VSRPATNLTATVIGASDPGALARFYAALLGWEIRSEDRGLWVSLRNPQGGPGLSFQLERLHRHPVWPGNGTDQQMMMHLDIEVADLEGACAYALSLGARKADFQPQDNVVVCYDPDGHPFDLWVDIAD
jgi:catechol 2,3-dioxygenase-like lactoylglutathione lyase family enzyme